MPKTIQFQADDAAQSQLAQFASLNRNGAGAPRYILAPDSDRAYHAKLAAVALDGLDVESVEQDGHGRIIIRGRRGRCRCRYALDAIPAGVAQREIERYQERQAKRRPSKTKAERYIAGLVKAAGDPPMRPRNPAIASGAVWGYGRSSHSWEWKRWRETKSERRKWGQDKPLDRINLGLGSRPRIHGSDPEWGHTKADLAYCEALREYRRKMADIEATAVGLGVDLGDALR